VPVLKGNGNQQFRGSYMGEYETESQFIPVTGGGSDNRTQVGLQGVQAGGSSEAEEIRSALREEQFETVIGSFGFEDNGLPAEGELTAPTGQWWDGAQRLAFPNTDSDRSLDFRYPIPPWGER
jgi:branched-chain amino acid transport system substrate-binding protein